MKGSSKMEQGMEKEFGERKKVLEEQLMKEIMSTIRKKAKGCINGHRAISIKGVLLMICDMDMGRCTGMMELITKGIGLMGFKKGKVNLNFRMEQLKLGFSGKMNILDLLSLNYQ